MGSPLMWAGWPLALPHWALVAASGGLAIGLLVSIRMSRRTGHDRTGDSGRRQRGHPARVER